MRCVGDLEANGLLEEADTLWCGVFKDIDKGVTYKFHSGQGELWYTDLLSFLDRVDVLIMHNGVSYDIPLLRKLFNYQYKGAVVDTLLVSRLQKPGRFRPAGCTKGPHSVEAWGMRFGRLKPEHEDWSRYSPEMLHRCSEDVEIQHEILKYLLKEGAGYNWKEPHILTRKVFSILQQQEEYGWLVDRPRMDRAVSLLSHWISRIDKTVVPTLPLITYKLETKTNGIHNYVRKPFKKDGTLSQQVLVYASGCNTRDFINRVAGPFSRIASRQVDINSRDELVAYLLSVGWEPAQWNTNDKGERTSPKLSKDDPFDGVEDTRGRLIVKRVQCRHRRSQIEGWIKVIREDGRISQGISGVASTGRLTHKRIVNVPGNDTFFGGTMRKLFISKPGYKIVGVDSAGCQNRMLAARVNDPVFTEILINGRKEDKTSIHYVNQKYITREAGFEPSYKVCKNLNYAFMFGASDGKLARVANQPNHVGSLIRKGLLGVSPGFAALVEALTKEWRRNARQRKGRYGTEYYNGYIIGLDGRPIFIESEHCILVYMLQSDEAILMQYALVFLHEWLTDRGWVHGREYGFVANVHDEIQAEVREDLITEYRELAERSISYAGEYLKINCPHEGSSDVGNSWYDTH